MTIIERNVLKEYIRQAIFLIMRHQIIDVLDLINFTARHDSDLSSDGYFILCSVLNGISDYDKFCGGFDYE